MKKLITLILALAMVFSLCACAGSGAGDAGNAGTEAPQEEAGLQIGYGRIDVTPGFSVGMDGHSNYETRRSDGFLDYLYLICIAAKSGDETILIYTLDNLAFSGGRANAARELITEATGIAGEKVFIGATHDHSAPSLSTSDPDCNRYYKWLLEQFPKVAKEALADLAPATALSTYVEIPGMNFIRHYLINDGTYAGSNFGSFGPGIADYAYEGDPRMLLVKFDREGDKKDVLMVNWAAHPDYYDGLYETTLSAEFPGALRDKLAADTDSLVAYFTGASGDQNPKSKIEEDKHGLKTYKDYGEKLAEYAYNALDDLKPVEGNVIKTNRVAFTVNVDHTMDHMIDQAREVYNVWKSTSKAAGNALAEKYGIKGVYHARGIINRINQPETTNLELNTFRIGDLGFITGTMEMFSTTGKYARDNSPFENTFIITGCSGYIPCSAAYDYGSYEAVSSTYQQGTAEQLAEQYVKMLNEIK